jgi:hypothetical protein
LGGAARAVQYFVFQFRTLNFNLSAWMMGVKPSQTFGLITFPPKPHGIDAAPHLPRHRPLRLTSGQPQNNIGTPDILGRKAAATPLGLQFGSISGTHFKRFVAMAYTGANTCIGSPCHSARRLLNDSQ